MLSGGFSDRAPPLPIPNREVKPVSADGTASWESRSPPKIYKNPSSEYGEGFFGGKKIVRKICFWKKIFTFVAYILLFNRLVQKD